MVTPPSKIRKEPPKPGFAIPKSKQAKLYDGPSSDGVARESADRRRMASASAKPLIAVRKRSVWRKGSQYGGSK